MSLTPIGITFGLVAVLFIGVAAASVRWAGGGWGSGVGDASQPPTPPGWGSALRAAWLPAAAEALVLTLLAALWFDSLGHGGWPTLFLLLGGLAGGADRWLRHRLTGTPARDDLKLLAADLLRFLLAGGLCAWCLT